MFFCFWRIVNTALFPEKPGTDSEKCATSHIENTKWQNVKMSMMEDAEWKQESGAKQDLDKMKGCIMSLFPIFFVLLRPI